MQREVAIGLVHQYSSSCSIVLIAKVVKSFHFALVSLEFIILKPENSVVFVVVLPINRVMHVAEVVKRLRVGVVVANFIPFESEQFALRFGSRPAGYPPPLLLGGLGLLGLGLGL
ncbi:hypothetical protein L3X38_002165 [Prunus dulcis]|uniref:Uncharacterized protein n=1 Tax=Prunus dulcis TaxID=3755 RepID=A0AAD4WTH3_PRUDU|nr:hypothetical protein L3X38_002165 [Prunus dulcis]